MFKKIIEPLNLFVAILALIVALFTLSAANHIATLTTVQTYETVYQTSHINDVIDNDLTEKGYFSLIYPKDKDKHWTDVIGSCDKELDNRKKWMKRYLEFLTSVANAEINPTDLKKSSIAEAFVCAKLDPQIKTAIENASSPYKKRWNGMLNYASHFTNNNSKCISTPHK